jgi:hypothetical protein
MRATPRVECSLEFRSLALYVVARVKLSLCSSLYMDVVHLYCACTCTVRQLSFSIVRFGMV